jgi:hypothetical protein
MAYNETYNTNDLTAIVSDGLGTAGAVIVGFLTIIVIAAVVIWGYRKIKHA